MEMKWVGMMEDNQNIDRLIESFDNRINKLMDEREEDIRSLVEKMMNQARMLL